MRATDRALYDRAKAAGDTVTKRVPTTAHLDNIEADWRESLVDPDTRVVFRKLNGRYVINRAVAIERVPHRLTVETTEGRFLVVHRKASQ